MMIEKLKIAMLCGVLVLTSGFALAQTPKPKAVTNMQADFLMERTLSALSDTLKSSGRLVLGGPGRLRWETLSPSKSLLVVNGDKAWIHYPDLGVTKGFDVSTDPLMEILSKNLLALTSGDVEKMKTLYNVEKSSEGEHVLVPKDEKVAKVFKEIRLLLGDAGLAEKVVLVSPSGDKTTITFQKIDTSKKLPDGLFDKPE